MKPDSMVQSMEHMMYKSVGNVMWITVCPTNENEEGV